MYDCGSTSCSTRTCSGLVSEASRARVAELIDQNVQMTKQFLDHSDQSLSGLSRSGADAAVISDQIIKEP